MPTTTGLARCLADPPAVLQGRRFGLLLNQASVDVEFRYAHELLAARFPGQLAALFAPQHGLFCEQQDNMIETPHSVDERLDVPVFSLYADRRKPTPDMLAGLDLLVVDLQDVGTRVYTFIWTLSYVMECCAEAGIPVLVLDRPNPIGGEIIEGPRLDPAFASFVGRDAIPMRHGLTMGEAARYLNASMGIHADVHVLELEGWNRSMFWPQTGLPWVPTSPNLPRFEGVLVYPGQVLLEGTSLSEARGATTPFELCGAPGIDPWALADGLKRRGVQDLTARPIRFEPTFHKHAKQSCGGVFLHAQQPASVRSYYATLALLATVREIAPDALQWLPPPYEYEETLLPIDILTGGKATRLAIDAGAGVQELVELAAVDAEDWDARTRPYRCYPGSMRC